MTDKYELLTTENMGIIQNLLDSKIQQLSPSPKLSSAVEFVIYESKNGNSIKVRINMKKHNLPYARAMEYGSGTRKSILGKRQSKHQSSPNSTIRIAPKKPGGLLAFHWEKANVQVLRGNAAKRIADSGESGLSDSFILRNDGGKFAGVASDGKYLFNYVDHPGIRAANNGKGYLRLSLSESLENIETAVGKSAAENLRIKLRVAFTRAGGHK